MSEQSKHEATSPGKVQMVNVSTVTNKNGDLVVINRNGKLLILDDTPVKKGKKSSVDLAAGTQRERERYALVYGSTLKVHEGQHVEANEPLVEWDPFTSAILTEVGGKVPFKDIVEGEKIREETDKVTGLTQMVIVESASAEKRTPTITVKGWSRGRVGQHDDARVRTGTHRPALILPNALVQRPGQAPMKFLNRRRERTVNGEVRDCPRIFEFSALASRIPTS